MGFKGSRKKEMLVHLPEEIILNIVVRLPVKSIGRCRCVCKFWFKLLKYDLRFVKMHLLHANQMSNFNLILYSLNKARKNIHTISCEQSYLDLVTRSKKKRKEKLKKNILDLVTVEYPFKSQNSNVFGFWGSCDGLVCFSPGCMARTDQHELDIVVVWNLCTGEYKRLPPAPIVGKPRLIEYGFGYDSKTEDFKVVSLSGNFDEYCSEVHLYSLGSNEWIGMETIPYNVLCQEVPDMGRLPVNGSRHWIAFRKSGQVTSKVILCFNFEKQVFEQMELPNIFDDNFKTNLCVLEGSLCLLGYIFEVQIDLWELKNYGVETSWTRLFTIDVKQLFFGYVGYLIPLRRFGNGTILLGFDKNGAFNMGLYDSDLQTIKTLEVSKDMTSYSASTSIYVESLHSLHTGTYLKPAEAEENFFDPRRHLRKHVIRSVTKENKPKLK